MEQVLRKIARQCVSSSADLMIPVNHAVIEFFRVQGIPYIFGKAGHGILPLLDSAKGVLSFVSAYREEAAVLMADGYARATGGPAVVLLSGGPAAAQSVAAMAQAFHDGSPVLLIASEIPSTYMGKKESATNGWGQQAVFQSLTRFSARVHNPQSIIGTLEEAYRSAICGKKGPVYCGIPFDLMIQETSETIQHHSRFCPPAAPAGDPEKIREACELLIEAQRPVILLGGGVVWSRATSEAMELAEFLFAPIVTSSSKSGMVPDDFPLSIGRLGSEVNKLALQTVAEADTLISIGCTFNDRTTFAFSSALLPPALRLIQVDIDPSPIGRNYPIKVGIIGDAKAVLTQILSCLRQIGAEKWPSRVIQRIQKVWERREMWINEWSRAARSIDVPIRRLRLLRDVVEEAGRHAIVFGELPWKDCLKASYFPLVESDDFPVSGSNLSFAMGAKLALPSRPAVAILGDGQFVSVLSDLATAVEHHIPVVAVVARNGCNGQVKEAQARIYAGRFIGVDHPFPNFADVALSLGAHGQRVENPSEIRAALREAFDSGRPALIEALVNE